MRRFVPWALLAASLSANLAVAAVALRQRASGAGDDEPLLFSKVALDPGQRARISALRAQLLATREAHARRLTQLRHELAGTMMHDAEDSAAITSRLRAIAESQTAFQEAVVEHVLAVRAVLRPEQRPAFEEVVAGQMQGGDSMHCGLVAPPGNPLSP